MRQIRHIFPKILIIAILGILLSACIGDPEWIFRVSKGEIQFEKKASYPDNMDWDYASILANGTSELRLYGFTSFPKGRDGIYQLTLRIMVEWPKSDSMPVYYPYNVAVQLGGISMAISDIFKSTYDGRDAEGKESELKYFRVRFACAEDSLKKVAEFRGQADAQLIRIDLSGLIMTGNDYVSIDPIYAKDSRQIRALPDSKKR